MKRPQLSELRTRYKARMDELGLLLIEAFHYLALFVIGASVVWSAVVAYVGIVAQGHATIGDILLLFILLPPRQIRGAQDISDNRVAFSLDTFFSTAGMPPQG